MSKYNGRKKRSTFTKRSHGATGTPFTLSVAAKKAKEFLRYNDPVRFELLFTRIGKRGQKVYTG